MKRQILPTLVALGLLAGLLAGCTSFTPVYGDRSGIGLEAARFNFAPPDNRIEQLIINRLKVAFPGTAGPNDPVLDIAARSTSPARSMSDAFEIGRPVNVRVEASASITQDGTTLFETTRFTDTAYQTEKLTPVNLAARDGAQETAANSTAEAVRAAILAGYRPAGVQDGTLN